MFHYVRLNIEITAITAVCGLGALLIYVFCFLVYSGVFSRVQVRMKPPPFREIKVAYKFVKGTNSKCRELIAELQNIAPELNFFIMYHNDLEEPTIDYTGYTVGSIVQGTEMSADQKTLGQLICHGYTFTIFPAIDNVIMVTFPYANQLSVIAAVVRVYPKLKQYIERKNLCAHPVIEIYTKKKILFVVPLSKQDAFYVPEAIPEYEISDSESDVEEPESVQYPLPKVLSKTNFGLKILNKTCCCDSLSRSHSCDYCKRAL